VDDCVVSHGACCFLIPYVPASCLEVGLELGPVFCHLGGITLSPFSACEVVYSCLYKNIVGLAENSGLGGLVIPFGCGGNVIFDFHKEGFDGGRWIPLCSHTGHVFLQLFSVIWPYVS
jgi:hypothetical protein